MNNFENQFGLFENNLEGFDSDIKSAVSIALETKESKEKINSGEALSLLFISEVINNLQKTTGDKYSKMIDYEEIIFPKIIKNVKGILDFLKIKHVFENDTPSVKTENASIDKSSNKSYSKKPGKHSGAGRFLENSLPEGDRE